MIKLVTQFDNEKSKISLATPTCGCCCSCCCCCCIISTVATASISARNFGNYVAKKLPNEPEKIKAARSIGFWLPIGLLGSIGIGAVFAAVFNSYVPVFLIGIMYLAIMAFSLKKGFNLSGIILRVILSSILLGVFEIIGSIMELYAIAFLGWFYLAGAILISILFIAWAFGKKYDNADTENNSNIQTNEDVDNSQTMKISNDNSKDASAKENLSLETQQPKKKCSNCGTENAIDNKRCFYCSNYFKVGDEKRKH